MKRSVNNPTDTYSARIRHRKYREAALIVPMLGLFLLLPPFIGLFSNGKTLFGIPLILMYIFMVWICLILITRFLASRLIQNDRAGHNDTAQPVKGSSAVRDDR